MPDADPASKPAKRPRRFWLWAPYGLAALAALAGAAGWLVEKVRMEQGLDQAASRLRAEGYDVGWRSRRVDGFPFRLDLTLEAPHVAERSGWALSAPTLKAEALAYTPNRWILVAPTGFTFTRPGRGPVDVSGKSIRASLNGLPGPATFAFQGLGLAFTPQPGAAPTALASADNLEIDVRPGPDDQAALLARLDGGRLSAAPATPVTLDWQSTLSHVSQMSGPDWPSMVRRWSAAGGRMGLTQASLSTGSTSIKAGPATLAVDADGRLMGAPLPLQAALAFFGAATAPRAY